MYKVSHVLLPLYFKNLFVLNNQVHACNTRQAGNLHAILNNTHVRAFSIQVYMVLNYGMIQVLILLIV